MGLGNGDGREAMGKGLRKEGPRKDQGTSLKSWYTENFSVGEKRLLTEFDATNRNKEQPSARRKTVKDSYLGNRGFRLGVKTRYNRHFQKLDRRF